MERQKLHLEINKDLWKRVSIKSAELGCYKRDIVEQAIEQYLKSLK